jgi:chromatin remodeling complex protein RSC6
MAADTITLDALMSELKAIHRDIRKIKQHLDDPDGEKARIRSENSTFKRPLDVTPELRTFLSLSPTDKISRADVSKRVNEYVKTNNLKNGPQIIPDENLQNLLKVPAGELATLTSLKLNKYLSPHFVKAVPVEPVVEKKTRPKVKA